jgi:pheromone shutdown protein TraB
MFNKFRSALREKQRLKWEKKRKNGKQSFMLYNGVLKWGGTMFVLSNINSLLLHQRVHWLYVVSMLIACSLAGYVWARCMWSLHEDRFYGAKKRQDSIKDS